MSLLLLSVHPADHPCGLRDAAVAPLVVGDRAVAALVTYHARPPGPADLRIISDLAEVLATQMRLSQADRQRADLARSELRALQAQISPHFVYNTLTTIASFVRTDPDRARELITEFADFTRRAAVDYLLKPVRPQRLRQTVDRLLSMRAGASVPADAMDDRLAVLSRGQIVLVAVDDVRVAETESERVTVRTHDGVYTARHTLADLERHLAPRGFLRVHRAHLVNLRHVLTVEAFFNGTYLLRLRDLPDVTVPVARRHAAALRAAIHI